MPVQARPESPEGGDCVIVMLEEQKRDPFTGYLLDSDGDVVDFDSDYELASASYESVTERLFDEYV